MSKRSPFAHWPFLLFIFLLPFTTLFSTRVLGVQLQLSDLAFVAAFLIWLVLAIKNGELVRWSWLYLFLAPYLAALALSTIMSEDAARSSVKLVGKLYLVSIAFLTFNFVNSILQLKRTLKAWLAAACVVLLLSMGGIVFFYLGVRDPSMNLVIHPIYGSLPPGFYPRIEGFFAYPAMLCNFLGITWMFAVLFALNGWVKKGHLWVFGILLFIVNAFTLTPGLGGICLASGYLLWKLAKPSNPMAGRAFLVGGFAIATLFLTAASVTLFSFDREGVDMPWASGEITASHRAMAWSTALDTFQQSPLFGRGVGTPVAEAVYRDPTGNSQTLTDAHNTYLSVLAETGLLGFLTFFGLIVFITWGLLKMRVTNNLSKWTRLCVLLALADALFYQGLTGSYEDSRHLWVLLGLAAAISRGGSIAGVNVSEAEPSDQSSYEAADPVFEVPEPEFGRTENHRV